MCTVKSDFKPRDYRQGGIMNPLHLKTERSRDVICTVVLRIRSWKVDDQSPKDGVKTWKSKREKRRPHPNALEWYGYILVIPTYLWRWLSLINLEYRSLTCLESNENSTWSHRRSEFNHIVEVDRTLNSRPQSSNLIYPSWFEFESTLRVCTSAQKRLQYHI